ncbi:hypothetical protein GIB67_015627 [Kingdonia uniflora]|uniref:Uncharacterized protein n=1 Tax=Kingdonia uniflora TaxID=39325 RepID=A0A7J7NTX9_9MAGN|nr:hypothetical protein GIB67_015627 [Kingdonia uniflora]
METERPQHRRRRNGNNLLLCFNSRTSSSSASASMKYSSSKSMKSPGRTSEKFGEPPLSLSSSLSRRLRSNGSMKRGQSSPMFPSMGLGGKKKGNGSSFETPEPSSPKVTCIGQVRVKSKKKQGNVVNLRSKSKRIGDLSFRKTEHTQYSGEQGECLSHRNQRWVHLPLAICEALRDFGSEFNCLIPCGGRRNSRSSSSSSCLWKNRSSPSSSSSSVETTTTTSGSCGAMLARWLWEEKRREMEFVERGEEKKERVELVVVDAIAMEIEETPEVNEEIKKQEEDEGRVSICVPPRNALLLMRSRSEPFRTSTLSNQFWDSPAPNGDEELAMVQPEQVNQAQTEDILEKRVSVSAEAILEEEDEIPQIEDFQSEEDKQVQQILENPEILIDGDSTFEEDQLVEHKDEIFINGDSTLEALQEEYLKQECRVSFSSTTMSEPIEEELLQGEVEPAVTMSSDEETIAALLEKEERETEEEMVLETVQETSHIETEQNEKQSNERAIESTMLPECLLLMMCEPKLSMEVSKETWVCSTDFIRHRHNQKINVQNQGGDEPKKVVQKNGRDDSARRLSTDSNIPPLPAKKRPHPQKQPALQPPRSSCSKITMATTQQSAKKSVNAVVYEPLSLTRCKSEPVRSSTKLAPEACFWKNMKLEPHRPNALGIGTAGIGA